MLTFTDKYVSTVHKYVGNEDALLFEISPEKATGKLKVRPTNPNPISRPYSESQP